MQHIIVQTSKAHYLVAPDWHINGAGYKGIPIALVSHFLVKTIIRSANMHICLILGAIILKRIIKVIRRRR